MKPVPADYFRTGVFANPRPGELLNAYTCRVCGTRFKTWARFRAHREEEGADANDHRAHDAAGPATRAVAGG